MNKHNAKDYLPLVQALAEGRVIQMQGYDGIWHDLEDVDMGLPFREFRIKPEPRKAWVWWPPVGSNRALCLTESRPTAEGWAKGMGGHITEVTDDT